MMNTLHSRSIAEHLSMLASLLEAEAIRANTLGLKGQKNIAREAIDVRNMANQLWDADVSITVKRISESDVHDRPPPVRQAAVAGPTELRLCS